MSMWRTSIGHTDNERIVIEASSGGYEENQDHTEDDALKLMKTLTSILVLKAYGIKNVRFEEFTMYKANSVQVMKRELTLSVLYKAFDFDERQSVTIPITYNERLNWFQVFELLTDFKVSI